MRVQMLTSLLVSTIGVINMNQARAQEITADSRNTAIKNIAQHIAANYVYPEKGGQIASHIQAANFKGQFDKATTWKEFDEMVTKELREFSNDGHLYVRHDPKVVKELKNPPPAGDARNTMNEQMGASTSTIAESKVLDNNIGYLKLTEIRITKGNLNDLSSHIKKMEGTKALIIDLRDNGGGGSHLGPVLESYFLPAGTPTLRFTKRDGNYTTDSTVTWLNEKKYEKPVYIIVNNKTASAAEAFAFVLQQNRRARIVGERSAGAANMNSWYAIDDENFVSVSTAAPSVPGKNVSWEQTGIQPDIRAKKEDPLAVATREASR
ncbi:MAG: S41 family peptidase [Chitinophagaceae bacterium]|nr:S41 family peptidase [Chitinophagaceae bacterium]